MRKTYICLLSMIVLLVSVAAHHATFADDQSAIDQSAVKAVLNSMNEQLASGQQDIRIEKVDIQTFDSDGITVYAKNRTLQLDTDWMPFDPWRFGVSDIYWATDQVDRTYDVPWPDAMGAIGRAMETWNSVHHTKIPLVQVEDYGLDLGVIQFLVGMGGAPGWLADITHAGWLPGTFFDIIGGPGGADSILGATFTFVWTARPDNVACKETYMNDEFSWAIDQRYFDIETVVLHEVGHALSLGHFGMLFKTTNGKLHFAPRAVMNAIYYDIQHELLGTDVAAFQSIWAAWPNK